MYQCINDDVYQCNNDGVYQCINGVYQCNPFNALLQLQLNGSSLFVVGNHGNHLTTSVMSARKCASSSIYQPGNDVPRGFVMYHELILRERHTLLFVTFGNILE